MNSLQARRTRDPGRAIAVAILVIGLAGCRGCREEGPGSVLELAAPETAAALWIPDLTALIRDAAAFAQGVTHKAGRELLDRFRSGVKSQLGIDPADPEAFVAMGLRLEAGALLFNEGEAPRPVLALGVSDRKKVDESLAKLVERADGANKREVTKHGAHAVITVGRPFGDAVVPVLHWAHFGRFVLLTHPEGKEGLVATLERLSKAPQPQAKDAAPQSLAASPALATLRSKVPPGRILMFVRGSRASTLVPSGLLGATAASTDVDAITSISLSGTGASVDTWLGLDFPEVKTTAPPVADLARRLEPGAVAYALSRAAHPDVVAALRKHPGAARILDQVHSEMLRATGIEGEKEALPKLAGPLTAAVYVTDLAAAVERMRVARRSSARSAIRGLLDTVHVVVTAELSDTEGMKSLLVRSKDALAERGIDIRARQLAWGEKGTLTVYEPNRPDPKLGWTVADDLYVYAVGTGRLESALAALSSKGVDPNATNPLDGSVASQLAATPGASVLVVRAAMLADALGGVNLSEKAPIGIGGVVTGVLEMLRTLGDVAVSFEPHAGGWRMRLRETLRVGKP